MKTAPEPSCSVIKWKSGLKRTGKCIFFENQEYVTWGKIQRMRPHQIYLHITSWIQSSTIDVKTYLNWIFLFLWAGHFDWKDVHVNIFNLDISNFVGRTVWLRRRRRLRHWLLQGNIICLTNFSYQFSFNTLSKRGHKIFFWENF